MFSYHQIARWLSFPTDPITVEDWVANREVFGQVKNPSEQDKELEKAYQLEKTRGGEFGFFEMDEVLLVAPETAGEAWVYGEKVERIILGKGRTITRLVQTEKPIKVKVKQINKKVLEWSGSGKKKIVFDL